jgi:hypothetical protein
MQDRPCGAILNGFETMRRFRRPGLKRPLMPNPGEFTRFDK